MTDNELHKLGRRDLLQLMLESAREAQELRNQLGETQGQLEELEKNYDRLKKRLDEKDAQIRTLREELQAARKKREIELQRAGSIAEAALRLNGVFEAAQKAAEQYIYNVGRLYEAQPRDASAIQAFGKTGCGTRMAERGGQKGVHRQGEEQGEGRERDGYPYDRSDRGGASKGKP